MEYRSKPHHSTTQTIATVAMAVLFSAATPSAQAAGKNACTWQSPSHKMAVAELFTSEGCSSCPPADRWLSQALKSSSTSSAVLPLAFHVDYWDYIGWKDPYASAQFTARQYAHRQKGNSKVIYTPQYVVSGKEYRDWGSASNLSRLVNEYKGSTPIVDIELTVGGEQKDSAALITVSTKVNTNGNTKANVADVSGNTYVVIYEDGLTQQVRAGENRGELLRHDGVVRQMFGPYPVNAQQTSFAVNYSLNKQWNKQNLGVGVFVENNNGNSVLQALNAPSAFAGCQS